MVGGGSSSVKGKLHGSACLLTPTTLVTARHVWSEIANRYDWPVVQKHDGLFHCEKVHEDDAADILFLKTTDKIAECDLGAPTYYPTLHPNIPSFGLSVGFLTAIRLHDEPGGPKSRYTAFSSASVSMLVSGRGPNRPPRFALDGGISQKGSSGGAVFTPNGAIVGVIVESWQFSADFDHPLPAIVTLPVMSPLYRFREIIDKIKKEDPQQGGPGYPPQGVGSPDP